MDCNLPERLVQDLEMSEAVFISKSMTAGTPCPALAADHHESLPVSFGNPIRAAQYHHILTTIRSLGELEEWNSKLEAEEARDHNESAPGADRNSDSISESSAGMEPPCIRFHEPSVTTAPTSVTSRRCSSPSQAPHLPDHSPMEKNPELTWVDLEPDDVGDELRASFEVRSMVEAEPRPNSSLGFNNRGDIMDDRQVQANSASKEGIIMPFHLPVSYGPTKRPHTSPGLPSQDKPRLMDAQPSVPVPNRMSSLQHRRTFQEPDSGHSGASKSSSGTTVAAPGTSDGMKGPSSPSSVGRGTTFTSGRTMVDATAVLDEPRYQNPYYMETERLTPKHVVVTMGNAVRTEKVPETASWADRSPPQNRSGASLGHVHNWLFESSGGVELPLLPNRHAERCIPGVPLPPEVIETLRISVVCFPETMLLSSSLTIETIRNYSRKFKHDDDPYGPDDQSLLSFSTSTGETHRRWKLSNLLSPRRAASPKTYWPKQAPTHSYECRDPSGGAPNWSSLKNIFPSGSDYLCDALYAHLVAYNYIGTLCRPGPPTSGAEQDQPRGSPGAASKSADNAKQDLASPIPKKAASLLGLSGGGGGGAIGSRTPDGAGGVLGRNKKTMWIGADGCPMRLRPPPADDPSMRELRTGLGKCISRLVATLRLTDGSEAPKVEAPAEVDPLLLRALCEVVRCSEETR